jgi:hypothetical protein
MVYANLVMTVETARVLLREMIGDGIGVGLETGKAELAREKAGETQRKTGTLSGIETEVPAETDNTNDEVSFVLVTPRLGLYGRSLILSYLDHPWKTGRHRDRSLSRTRSRSRSPARNGPNVRTRSPPKGPKSDRNDTVRESRIYEDGKAANGSSGSKRLAAKSTLVENMDVDSHDVDGETEGFDELMRKTMGFSSFRSTQNTKVPGNNIYGVRKEKKTEYRQYMNRKGGFNRPLSPSR